MDYKKIIGILFVFFIYITLLIALVHALYTGNWEVVFLTIITLILVLVPYIFERTYKIHIPLEFELSLLIFIYAAIFLGIAYNFYDLYWWWDIVLHGFSAVMIGLIGFIILFIFYKGGKIKAKPFTIALFSFSFALAAGAVWEIFEFAMDWFFKFDMQKSGLVDTMVDLIIDSAGALIASFIGFLYIKKSKLFFIGSLIDEFINANPLLFGNKRNKRPSVAVLKKK